MIVYRFLTEHFAHYVDYQFTAHLEDELDEISRGEREWVPVLKEFWDDFKPIIDEKMELKRQDVSEDRQLGIDPVSGRPVSARLGRFGPMVQIGTKDDPEKPKFAGIPGKLRIDTITLAQALELFKLPRKLGQTVGGDEIEVNIGRFGPYVRHGKSFVSLKKDDDPFTIELPRAIELVLLGEGLGRREGELVEQLEAVEVDCGALVLAPANCRADREAVEQICRQER